MAGIEIVEGNSIRLFTAIIASSVSPSTRFNYLLYTSEGTATPEVDFVTLHIQDTVGVGYTVIPFVLKTIDDDKIEGNETFTVTLFAPGFFSTITTITIIDNDKLNCISDLNDDGRASRSELDFSTIWSKVFQIDSDISQTRDTLMLVNQKVSDLKLQTTLLQRVGSDGLVNELKDIIDLDTDNSAATALSSVASYAQSLYDGLTGVATGSAATSWHQLGTILKGDLSKSLQLRSMFGALDAANGEFSGTTDNTAAIADLTKAINNIMDAQGAANDQYDQLAAARDALHACLVQQAAATGEAIKFEAGIDPATALDIASGPIAATAASTTSSLLAEPDPGFYIAIGSAGADIINADASVVSEADAVLLLNLGAGDDEVRVNKGSAFVVGGDGTDAVLVTNGSGGLDLVHLATASVVDAATGEMKVFNGNQLFLATQGVEFVIFEDGFFQLDKGKLTTHTLNATVFDGRANVLRDKAPIDAIAAVQQQLQWETDSQAQGKYVGQLIKDAGGTTSVATLAYEFFTGKTPSSGGLDYLVSATGPNPNNLNSAYYQTFNLENRYINFAVNLGKLGDGAEKFAAQYGSLSLFDSTKKAYAIIFGSQPTDAKVHTLLDSRVDYFSAYGLDGPNGIGTKAAMVGWLLAEAVKADIGTYAKSNDAYLTDLSDGAGYAFDLIGVYAKPEFDYVGP